MNGKRAAAAALVAAFVLAGCPRGGEPAPDTESTIRPGAGTVWGEEATPPDDPAAPRPVHLAGAATIVGDLTPIGGSGVTGSMTIRAEGARTLVSIEMSGAPADAPTVVAAVHEGTCATLGREIARLDPLPVQQTRIVSEADTLDVAPATVMNGRNVLVVRSARAAAGAPALACAAIPEIPPAPPGTQPGAQDPPETGSPGATVPPSRQPGTAPGTPPPGSQNP
jgi:hypothetical protein